MSSSATSESFLVMEAITGFVHREGSPETYSELIDKLENNVLFRDGWVKDIDLCVFNSLPDDFSVSQKKLISTGLGEEFLKILIEANK